MPEHQVVVREHKVGLGGVRMRRDVLLERPKLLGVGGFIRVQADERRPVPARAGGKYRIGRRRRFLVAVLGKQRQRRNSCSVASLGSFSMAFSTSRCAST